MAALSRMSSACAASRAIARPTRAPRHSALGFFGSSSMQVQQCREGKLGSLRNGNGFNIAVRRVAVQPAQKGLVVEAKKEKKTKLKSHRVSHIAFLRYAGMPDDRAPLAYENLPSHAHMRVSFCSSLLSGLKGEDQSLIYFH